jgi:hypothetical protein
MRPAEVVLPLLRAALPDVKVSTWIEDVDYRTFPMVAVRRAGGARHATRPNQFSLPVLELSAFSNVGLVEAEELYEDVLESLYGAVDAQTQTPAGYLHSIKETEGATQRESPFPDTWTVQGSVRLGLRPARQVGWRR